MDSSGGISPWFRYFPEHYLWSQLMCEVLSLEPMGGAALWEVDQVGQRLKGKVGDGAAWRLEWENMAERVEAQATREDDLGHALTAAGHWVRSAFYLYAAERFIRPDDPAKAASYRKVVENFQRGMRVRLPGFERVEVPYEDGPLPAYWIPPLDTPSPAPAVVFFDGLDVSKEFTALWGALALRERGVGCLCVDGPGQGEALRLRKIPSRPDYEVPGAAAYDCIAARKDVDPGRVGIMALSMGGYYAPRIAAFEHRYAACLAWGAHFDYHEVWAHRRKVLEAGGSVASSAIWQLPFVMGRPDMDSAMEKCRAYTLAGVAEKIRMPILILHGELDAIVPVRMAHRLYEACGSKDKELKVFRPGDGGSQHCIVDNLQLVSGYIADWWRDRFYPRGR